MMLSRQNVDKLIIGALVVSISLLLSDNLEYAYAITVNDYSLGFNPRASIINEDILNVVGGSAGGQWRQFNLSTGILGATRNLVDDVPTITGTAEDIDCRSDICYIWVLNSGNEDAWLLRYNDGVFEDSMFFQTGSGTQIAIGGNSDTVFVADELGGADNCVHTGTATHTNIYSVGWTGSEIRCTGLAYSTGADVTVQGMAWSGQLNSVGDFDDNHLLISQGASGANELHILNLATFSAICTASLTEGGYAERIGDSYFVSNGVNVNRFTIDDTPNCVSDQTISAVSFDGGTYNSGEDNLYLADQANDRINAYNWTGTGNVGSLVQTFNTETAGALQARYSSSQNKLTGLIPSASNILRVWTLGESEVGQSEVCIDTGADGIADVCFQDNNGDGLADTGGTGAFGIVANTNPPAQMVGGIFCQTGFIEACTNGQPTNSDIQQNGVGLVLFFLLLAFMIAVIGASLYGHIKVEYNLMMQIPIVMIATGLAVALGWIETLWFYIMIFVIIGFASLATTAFVLKQKKGGGD